MSDDLDGGPDDPWPPPLSADERRALVRAERRFRDERGRLYRAYLKCLVRRASPLLIDLAETGVLDVTDMLRRIRPARAWPYPWGIRPRHRIPTGKGFRMSAGPTGGYGARPIVGRDPDTRHRISLERDKLQPEVRLGDAMIWGIGDAIEVWVSGSVPHTLADAVVGRPLATVVHHELFECREYRILKVVPGVGHWSIITASAPSEPVPSTWLPDF